MTAPGFQHGAMGMVAGVTDQGAATLASFVVTVAVARKASTEVFGAYVLVQVFVVLVLGSFRATVGTSLLTASTRFRDDPDTKAQSPLPGALTTATMIWLLAIVAGALTMTLWSGGALPLAWGIAVGPLLYLDALRCRLHGRDRHVMAAVLSVTLLAVLGVSLLVIGALGPSAPEAVVLGYGAAAGLVLVVVAGALGVRPGSLRSARALVTDQGRVWQGYAANYFVDAAGFATVPFIVAAVGGLPAAAGVRAAQAVAGLPLQIPQGLTTFVLARGADRHARGGTVPRSWALAWAGGQLLLFAAVGVALLMMSEEAGRTLLGETWEAARTALPWILLASLLSALTLWPDLQHRIRGTSGRMARVRLWNVPIALVLAGAGTKLGGAPGAAAGLTFAGFALLAAALRSTARADNEERGVRRRRGTSGRSGLAAQ